MTAPKLIRPALREYRSWVMDSRRWADYRPREGDIIVNTYPKCGTTWMQRIVSMLIFKSVDIRPVAKLSPWYDMRVQPGTAELNAMLEAQTHRRALKTHLPFDGMPLYEGIKYIVVGRDGRDACLSFHNHGTGFTPGMLADLDKAGLEDDTLRRPYPRLPEDPADYFHQWLTESELLGQTDGRQNLSYFDQHNSYWAAQDWPNLLMTHYASLKRDLLGEMKRIAAFLEIEVEASLWPELVEAASFETMKRQGNEIAPFAAQRFVGGAQRFFHKGETGRWKGIFRPEDLALYDRMVKARLPPDCTYWLRGGPDHIF